jgi:ribosomal-protein-alanine N-acetyltransferase
MTTIDGTLCRLRPYTFADADALAALANDFAVTRWMTAGFPFPYTRDDAARWLAIATAEDPPNNFAIEVDGSLAGGAGIGPLFGEHGGTAIFGYWVAPRYWGRGVATEAARLLARYALHARGFRRVEASVFAPNAASVRVLEKAGFTLEGRLRQSYVERDGTVCDGLLYARLASDPDPDGSRGDDPETADR